MNHQSYLFSSSTLDYICLAYSLLIHINHYATPIDKCRMREGDMCYAKIGVARNSFFHQYSVGKKKPWLVNQHVRYVNLQLRYSFVVSMDYKSMSHEQLTCVIKNLFYILRKFTNLSHVRLALLFHRHRMIA